MNPRGADCSSNAENSDFPKLGPEEPELLGNNGTQEPEDLLLNNSS